MVAHVVAARTRRLPRSPESSPPARTRPSLLDHRAGRPMADDLVLCQATSVSSVALTSSRRLRRVRTRWAGCTRLPKGEPAP
jgi:hypothetical protein